MALEAAFRDLGMRLLALQEALIALRTTVREDRPLHGDVVLVDLFGDAADDLLGWLEGALSAAREGDQAAAAPPDLQRTGQALAASQERFNHIANRLTSDLLRYERIDELVCFGRARGGEWNVWAMSVKEALDWCQPPVFDAGEALFGCWRELAARADVPAITMGITNIGQHLPLSHGPNTRR